MAPSGSHGLQCHILWPVLSISINIAGNENSVANLKFVASCGVWVGGKDNAASSFMTCWWVKCWDFVTRYCIGNFVPPTITIRIAPWHLPSYVLDSPEVYQSSSYLVNTSLLPLSFCTFLPFNLFRWCVVEGSGHSSRARCSKLLGGNARFTCSQKCFGNVWGTKSASN